MSPCIARFSSPRLAATCRAPLRSSVVARNASGRRRTCTVRAAAQEQPPKFDAAVNSFFQRYDFPSAMVGSLLVTGVCVSHGQSPIQALSITLTSTVLAVVANELLSANERR